MGAPVLEAVLNKDLRARLLAEIQEYAQARTDYVNDRRPGVHQAMWTAFRAGVTESKVQRRRRSELVKTLTPPTPTFPRRHQHRGGPISRCAKLATSVLTATKRTERVKS